MAMNVTVDTLLERVKAMAPMLRAYAAEAEAQRRLARPVIDARCSVCKLSSPQNIQAAKALFQRGNYHESCRFESCRVRHLND